MGGSNRKKVTKPEFKPISNTDRDRGIPVAVCILFLQRPVS